MKLLDDDLGMRPRAQGGGATTGSLGVVPRGFRIERLANNSDGIRYVTVPLPALLANMLCPDMKVSACRVRVCDAAAMSLKLLALRPEISAPRIGSSCPSA
jgi:hypothetical protein